MATWICDECDMFNEGGRATCMYCFARRSATSLATDVAEEPDGAVLGDMLEDGPNATVPPPQDAEVLVRWVYASLRLRPFGNPSEIVFSHALTDVEFDRWVQRLGGALKGKDSGRARLHVKLLPGNPMVYVGLLGDEGYEVCGYASAGDQAETYILKRRVTMDDASSGSSG